MPVSPRHYSIKVRFKQGYDFRFSSVDELLAQPMTGSRQIENMWINAADYGTARPFPSVSVYLRNDFLLAPISIDVSGEADFVQNLANSLDHIIAPTAVTSGYIFNPRFFLDFIVLLVVFNITARLLIVHFGFSDQYQFSLGIIQLVGYAILKVFLFPRGEFYFGAGIRPSDRRKAIKKYVALTLALGTVVGALQRGIVSATLDWWNTKA